MKAQSRKKQKRRRQGKYWVSQYDGNNITHAYKQQFKIPLITAINDLEALGVTLDRKITATTKLNRHYYGQQHMSKDKFNSLIDDLQKSE